MDGAHSQAIHLGGGNSKLKPVCLDMPSPASTGVMQKVQPVLSTEALLHIWLSSEYYGFRPSSTAVDTVS